MPQRGFDTFGYLWHLLGCSRPKKPKDPKEVQSVFETLEFLRHLRHWRSSGDIANSESNMLNTFQFTPQKTNRKAVVWSSRYRYPPNKPATFFKKALPPLKIKMYPKKKLFHTISM